MTSANTTAPAAVRFAPSPTGALHAGGARTALFNYLFRLKFGGRYILRIEDTDRERNVSGAEEGLRRDLEWLGLHFDESEWSGGPAAPYRQSLRRERHIAAAGRLLASGAAFRCCCPPERLEGLRREAASQSLPPRYDRRCLHSHDDAEAAHNEGVPTVVRLLTPRERILRFDDLFRGAVEFSGAHLDDPIIVRSDGSPTTLLAGVVDDAEMGVTHILRGEEWIASTPYQMLIFEALGYPPPRWGHLSLLLGDDGAKLSKRTPGLTVSEMRTAGILPEAINRYLAGLGRETIGVGSGWTLDDLAGDFVPERYRSGGTVFSLAALRAESGRLLRWLPPEEIARRMTGWRGFVPPTDSLNEVTELAREEAETLEDVQIWFERIFQDPNPDSVFAGIADGEAGLKALKRSLESVPTWDLLSIESALKEALQLSGGKAKDFYHPVRLALTGVSQGPKLARLIQIIGRESTLRRLDSAGQLIRAADRTPAG